MPMLHPFGQCPRGALNALHHSAICGSAGRVSNLLSKGTIGVDDTCCAGGRTPLLYSADRGDSRITKILLEAGADVTAVSDGGVTALHISAKRGHLPVTTLLIKAGADLEASDIDGYTPLLLASQLGNHGVVDALVEAGASVDHPLPDGATPMYLAAEAGQFGVVRVLLRFNADPQLSIPENGFGPLVVATAKGNTDIVHELLSSTNLDGCVGSTHGALALHLAAQNGYVSIMEMLYKAGAKDGDGEALCAAVKFGGQQALDFLLQRPEVFETGCTRGTSYVNHIRESNSLSPLLCCVTSDSLKIGAIRVLRRLIDAGADTTTIFRDNQGVVSGGHTSMELVEAKLEYLKHGLGHDSDTMCGLHGLRRLLMTEEAIHALSWGWTSTLRQMLPARKKTTVLLPLMRRERQATKSRVVLRTLLR